MTVSVGSTICLSPASVGIQWRPAFSRSPPVITASTPGILRASVASMPLIVACAYGLRTMSSQSWPGRLTSSMYSPRPRMKRGSSLRLTEWPIPPISALVRGSCASVVIFVTPRSTGRDRLGAGHLCLGGSGHLAGRLLDRLHDVHVAGTPAQVAADPLADLRLGRCLVLPEKPGGLHDHPRGAEPALQAMLIPERLLERVEAGAVGHPLDGLDLPPVRLDGQHRARLGALAVDMDGARAAVARIAAHVRPGQPEVVTQQMDEQEAGLHIGFVDLAVDGDRDVLGAHRCGPPTRTRGRVRWRGGVP